jgi:histidine triad (HIT) family protein
MDCIFCKIINNEIPSYTIYENEYVKVFLDVFPSTNGHLLIVPKKHFENLKDIDEQYLHEVMLASKKMQQLLEEKMHYDGLTIQQNNGLMQDVKHYHMHLKPVFIK